MTDVKNKIIWVTGASSGIGAALAKVFSGSGANIILSGRNVEALENVASSLKTDSLVLPFEVTNYEALAEHVKTAWSWKGRVDVFVNNAGVSQRSLALQTDPKVYTDLINIDLIAPIWLTQLNLTPMVEAGGAHIVAISSIAGRIGAPLRTAYSAAKHGLLGYMDALRAEVEATHNIKVTNILPGSVATDISRNALTKDGSRRGVSDENIDKGDSPIDCANAILQAVKDDVPELIYAGDFERGFAEMRHTDPEKFFEMIAGLGAQIAAAYEAGDET